MRRSIGILLAVLAATVALTVLPPAAAAPPGATATTALTWEHVQATDLPRGFTSVSCVTNTVCRAGDHGNRVVRWDGRHWLPGTTMPADLGYYTDVDDIDCPSTTFCAAVQQDGYDHYRPIVRRADGTWNVSAPSIAHAWVGSVSCVDRTFCMLATSGTYQTWNGTFWSSPKRVGPSDFRGQSVQCLTRTLCRMVDSDGAYNVWNGASWSTKGELGAGGELSCPATTFCMLAGATTWRRFNGTTWSSAHAFPAAERLSYQNAISCVGPTYCVSTRNDGHAYTWDGQLWRGPTSLGVATTQDVSCASKDFCVVTTLNGNAVHRVNGTWQAPRHADPAVGGYSHVACDSGRLCVLVDIQGGSSVYDGSSWSTPDFVPDHGFFHDISCAGGSFCLATERNGSGQFRRGGVWSERFAAGDGRASCGSTSLCITTDVYQEDSGDYTTTATVWDPSGRHDLDTYAFNGTIEPACAVDGCVLSLTYRDAPGDARTVVYRPGEPEENLEGSPQVVSASCASVTFCLGVTDDNEAVRFDGASWTTIPGRIPRISLSCASTTLCAAVGSHSAALWDGTSWGAAHQIIGGDHEIYDVSCKPGICVATGYGYTVIAR